MTLERHIILASMAACLLGTLHADADWQRQLIAQDKVFYTIDEEKLKEEPKDEVIIVVEPGETTPEILINFSDVNVTEYVRFLSSLTGKNFIFDEKDMNFTVTIVSDKPTTIENMLTALFHELRIHGLTMIEEGKNIIIHSNDNVNSISKVSTEDPGKQIVRDAEIITQVFSLNTLDPSKAADLIRPLSSSQAIIEYVAGSQHLIITDLANNIAEISVLLKNLDAPTSGLVIGQYVIQQGQPTTLIELAEEIMGPIAGDQTIKFVTYSSKNTLFVISTPFLVEKTLSVLQNLDQARGTTRIFDLDDLQFDPRRVRVTPLLREGEGRGRWELDENGNWIFRTEEGGDETPEGKWLEDAQNNWYFQEGEEGEPDVGPRGKWVQDRDGNWNYELDPGATVSTRREVRPLADLPPGLIERTKFYIHKLKYRQGEQIVEAMTNISTSLDETGTNADLVSTIDSLQYIVATNSLVLTGTPTAIAKVNELISEIDIPLRQVFIEMLIIETDIDDSLTYGVNWGSKHGGGQSASAQAFTAGASPLSATLATSGVDSGTPKIPDASGVIAASGYNLGIIGQTLTKDGVEFQTLALLVKALHDNTRTNIIMNPKILTEDNSPAEIFVGINTQFQTDSISNDEGSVITTNFEFRDIGTLLKVTPLISSNDIVTLDIQQEISSAVQGGGEGEGEGETSTSQAGPTTRVSRTFTRVHVPDKHFLVISGMINDEITDSRSQLPCLGGVPILGAFGSAKVNTTVKRNLMIFMRPQIVDTIEEIHSLTRHQQEVYRTKSIKKDSWKFEVDHMMDFLNLQETPCDQECR